VNIWLKDNLILLQSFNMIHNQKINLEVLYKMTAKVL
jgi:hypothetical protein